ncbi:MAG TPA: chitobiase/beta-hexosaminidase C-terminal domain-containing protein, partial [Ilumatobacteraceae bacterium]|nr:chitobiase/beta-hexosaminidase C-terminal domain-containing protein [Ilumatobacteraceae bacterium]
GSTVFFRPGTNGGFTVSATTADGGSGVQHVAFPALGANWTGGGNDAGAPYAQAYTFDASAADPTEPNDVFARNGAGLDSTATPFTVTADSTAPTTTIACDGGACPGGWTTSAADVTLSADDGSGSGVAEIRYTVDGSDPLVSGTLYTGAFSVAATTTVRFAAVDAVGNAETVGSQLLQIDDSKPTTPTLAFSAPTNAHWDGSVLWFRAGAAGGFTVTPNSSDPQSGVSAYHYPALGSGWSNIGGAYTFAAGAADPTEPNDVTAENAAGLVSDPTSFTVTADGAAPTGASATVAGGATSSLSVAVATNGGTDAGSGVDAGSLVVERQEADLDNGDGTCDAFGGWTTVTLTAGADTGVVSGKCYRYRVRSSDRVGNEATSPASATVQVDTAAPGVTLNDPGANLAGTVTLSAAATDAASGIASVVFQRSPADAGTWTTISGSWDTTTVADGLYDLRAIATDAAGNATTSAVVEDRRVDNVNPDTTIDSAPADPDNDATPTVVFSGSEPSTFQCRFDGGAWSPCASPLTAGALPDGARTFEVRAIDASANPDPSPASHAWVLDTVAPSGGSITVADGWDTDGSVAIATDNGTDAGGTGVATASAVVEREAATLTTGTCGPFDAAWSTVATPDASVAGGACYRYRLRVRDNAGNWVTYPSASVVKVDLTAPTVPSLTLATVSGSQVAGTTAYFRPGTSGSFTVTPVSSDPESGGVTFSNPSLGTGWSRVGTTWSFDGTAGDPNEPNNVTATNAAGLTSGAATFTVTADSAAPVTTASAAPAANGFGWHTASPVSVTLSAADGGSGVKEIRYTTDGSVPGPTSPLYAAPVDIVSPGTTTLTFRAEDN